MPIIEYTASNVTAGVKLITWANMANGDTGRPFICPQYADKSAQVTGTFGAGGNCNIEGTNFESTETWATLNDPQGTPLAIGSAKIEQILENTYKVRPSVSGDGSTSLTVRLLVSTPTEQSGHIPNS